MGQRWSALAGLAVPRGRDPGPSAAREATSGPSIKPFLLVCVVLLVLVGPATNSGAYAAVVKRMELHLSEDKCQAGQYRDPVTGTCKECWEGVSFTAHSNNFGSCRPCSICKSDTEIKSPCNTTRDTECQCKPGTYRNQENPEMCVRCTDSCNDGFEEESPCVPWSDRKCVRKDSGTKASRETPASAEPVTATLSNTTCPHPSSDHGDPGNLKVVLSIVFGIIGVGVVILLVLGWKLRGTLARLKNRLRCGQDSEHLSLNTGSEAQDNDHNEMLSTRNSSSTLDVEQPGNRQDLGAGVTGEFPGEGTSLLIPAETERAPRRRRRLIPAEGTNTIETIRQFFICHQNIIPCRSWDNLMRLLGLEDNEIQVIKYETENQGDVLYQMMVKWLNKKGREACINTLLDSLEKLQERSAREKIEEYLVTTGKFVYQEDGADSTVPLP